MSIVFQGLGMTTITVQQAAEQLQVSPATIYGLCAQKRLGHIRVGSGRGTIRIRAEDLSAYVANAAIEPGSLSKPLCKLKRLRLRDLAKDADAVVRGGRSGGRSSSCPERYVPS